MVDLYLYSRIVRSLGFKGVSRLARDRLFSINNVFILHKGMASVAAPDPLRMQFSMSRVEEGDWNEILRQAHCVDTESRREIFARALFFRNGFRNCYALRSKTGFIAHVQWVVFPEENALLSARYPRFFMELAPFEVMIENAFTFPKFRGLGLYSHATNHLLNLAKERGYKKACAYVRCGKVGSLNELIRLGFSFRMVVREYKFLGFIRRGFEERTSGGGGKAIPLT